MSQSFTRFQKALAFGIPGEQVPIIAVWYDNHWLEYDSPDSKAVEPTHVIALDDIISASRLIALADEAFPHDNPTSATIRGVIRDLVEKAKQTSVEAGPDKAQEVSDSSCAATDPLEPKIIAYVKSMHASDRHATVGGFCWLSGNTSEEFSVKATAAFDGLVKSGALSETRYHLCNAYKIAKP